LKKELDKWGLRTSRGDTDDS